LSFPARLWLNAQMIHVRRLLLPCAVLGWSVCAAGALSAAPPPVVILRGTISTPNEGERRAAQRTAGLLERRLGEIGIPVRAVNEEQAAAALVGARVAVLSYNPLPPADELAALRLFVERGGRLLVFYSSSPELARLLGFRLGEYRAAPGGGRWSAFRFTEQAPPHLPALVRQESRNIRPAVPIPGRSQIIAEWYGSDGQPTGDPAWVLSDRGAWMSHVLLGDADAAAQRHLLLGLLAAFDPELWEPAARVIVERAGRLRPLLDFESSAAQIRSDAGVAGRSADVETDLRRAEKLRRDLAALMRAGRYAEAAAGAADLSAALMRSYALAQPSRPGERRAVWDHAGTGLLSEGWEATARRLSQAGVSDVFVNVLWPGAARCASGVVPAAPEVRLHGDCLAQALDACGRVGVRVHVWKVCWKMELAPRERVERLAREKRLVADASGKRVDWMCPTHPDNRREEWAALADVARRYPRIAGVHLDYVRFPDARACFCAGCRERFAQSLGRPPRAWPPEVAGAEAEAFVRWRAGQITSFVAGCRKELDAVRPGLTLSAAVYGSYPSSVRSVGQDWPAWVSAGTVDFACPMNYFEDTDTFRRYVLRQAAALGPNTTKLIPGIGVTADESRLDPVHVMDQIAALRAAGAGGFALFDLSPTLADDILPFLRLGVSAPARRP
jgi:uncharacterized lipoprotein YddW (UPF0748 family)